MEINNVQSQTGVTLVGGADPRPENIDAALTFAPYLVAADGGANHCLKCGKSPDAVIGDFDSIDPATQSALADSRLIRISEQETTDFEKALSHINAPFVLATGFTTARLDHTLAAFNVLVRQVGPTCLILGEEDVIFSAPKQLVLDIPKGTRVSLFPLSPISGKSEGLEWPIDGLELSPNGQIGTSNRANGLVKLQFDNPGCLILLPRSQLQPSLNALIE